MTSTSSEDAINPLVETGIEWLRENKVLGYDADLAKLWFGRLRNPTNDRYVAARERLLRLVDGSDSHSAEPPAEVHKFSAEEFPGYTVIVMVNNALTLVQRVQRSGLCYMHAGAVVQYYAIWHWARKEDPNAVCTHGMLNITKDIKTRFKPKMLERHIFHDEGGDSEVYLGSILEKDSILRRVELDDIERCLIEFGPCLLGHFAVHRDFIDEKSQHHHRGVPQGEEEGRHAMVIVGARRDSRSRYFLLQNWWQRKQFVQVDEAYVRACGGRAFFVVTPQRRVPAQLPTLSGHWFEATGLDKPESMGVEQEDAV